MNLIGPLLNICTFVMNSALKAQEVLIAVNPKLYKIRKKMKSLPLEGNGKDLYIILNGPSLKTQDLSKLLGKTTMFVNRGFMHPSFKDLKPAYHTFIDTKIRDGVWDIKWIDQIFDMSPNTKIILPICWYTHPRFAHLKNDNRIYWQYWKVPIKLLGVSGACISFAIKEEFENIYFTGFDANGCAYDMVKSSDSHFYGADPELANMTTMQHANAMFSTAMHFNDLNRLGAYCKTRNIKIFNLTNGGLLDMFPRCNMLNE